MVKVDREKQFKEAINKLEQLVLQAENDKNETLYQWGEDSGEYKEAEAYEEGAFQAYVIIRKTFEGDYE